MKGARNQFSLHRFEIYQIELLIEALPFHRFELLVITQLKIGSRDPSWKRFTFLMAVNEAIGNADLCNARNSEFIEKIGRGQRNSSGTQPRCNNRGRGCPFH